MSLVRCQRRGFNGHKAQTDPAVFFREVEHIMTTVSATVRRLLREPLVTLSSGRPEELVNQTTFFSGEADDVSPEIIETLVAVGALRRTPEGDLERDWPARF